jgi:F0F1-type ATP synthase membrane subunit b/b'
MFEDPKFWLLISFITFCILMYKPFKSMMIGGLDTKIEEIKNNLNSSLKSFDEAENKLNEAQKQTSNLDNKINEILASAKFQAESVSEGIIEKTTHTISSKEKSSLERIKQIELSAIQSIKNQTSKELNNLIIGYLSSLSVEDREKVLGNSLNNLKSLN